MPDITSRQHPMVRAFKLAARGASDLALIDGWHLLHDAEDAAIEIATVAVAGAPPDDERLALLERVARRGDVVTVSPGVLAAISPVRTPSGIVALVRPVRRELRELLTPPPALVVVAVDVQDPGNAGAIVRSAEAGGATGVLFGGAAADPWSWKSLRAGMGSTFRLPVLRQPETVPACEALRACGLGVCAAVPRHGTNFHDVDLRQPTAVVLGGEGAGLSTALLSLADVHVTIPMRDPVESLNVSAAAALLVYEARRQRTAAR